MNGVNPQPTAPAQTPAIPAAAPAAPAAAPAVAPAAAAPGVANDTLALGAGQDPVALALSQLQSTQETVRFQAVVSLAHQPAARAIPALQQALTSTDPQVVALAKAALAKLQQTPQTAAPAATTAAPAPAATASAATTAPPAAATAAPTTAPTPPAAIQPNAPLTGTAPAAAPAAPAAPPIDMIQMQTQLLIGSSTDKTLALYQLESGLNTSQRAQVLPLLLSQIGVGSGGPSCFAAIQILSRNKTAEAAPYLQKLAMTAGEDAGVRAAAAGAYQTITGQPLPGFAQTAAGTVADPQSILKRLQNPATAPQAAIDLSKLPTSQILPIADQVLRLNLGGQTDALLVAVLDRHAKEAGVAAELRIALQRNPAQELVAVEKAAIGLASTHDPTYAPDLIRFLSTPSSSLAQVQRAIVDAIASTPALLQAPGMDQTLAALMQAYKTQPQLAQAASHALGGLASAQARTFLAGSPLLGAPDAQSQLRALWDLQRQPPPYPAATAAALQKLQKSKNAQVAALAKQLLAGVGK